MFGRGSEHIQSTKDNLLNKILGKLERYMQKSESRPPSYMTHKNKFKMDQRLKCWAQNHKNHKRKHRQQKIGHCS